METLKIAVIVVRLSGFTWLVTGLNYLTYLPERMWMSEHARAAATIGSTQIEIKMLMARALLHLSLGLAMLWFARPLARLFARGLALE